MGQTHTPSQMFFIRQSSASSPANRFLLLPTTVLSPSTHTHFIQKTAHCTRDLQIEH